MKKENAWGDYHPDGEEQLLPLMRIWNILGRPVLEWKDTQSRFGHVVWGICEPVR